MNAQEVLSAMMWRMRMMSPPILAWDLWAQSLTDAYVGRPAKVKLALPVCLSAVAEVVDGELRLSDGGRAWVEETVERCAIEALLKKSKCADVSTEVSGATLVVELMKMGRVAKSWGRGWEQKVASKAARWIEKRMEGESVEESTRKAAEEAVKIAGEVIASWRVCCMRGHFENVPLLKLDVHLKPWVDRLGKVKEELQVASGESEKELPTKVGAPERRAV